ncbi:MAG TPA: LptE family protein [Syntrophales bacterium]|nr:LptE family protein [Syntrophales bacterium]
MFPRNLSISWFSKESSLASPFCKAGLRGIYRVQWIAIFVVLLTTFLFSSCGYRFSPGGEYIDKTIRTVFIDNFSNRTSEANIENSFRTAFIDQFIIGGRFTLIDNREKADAIFKASINNLTISPLAYQKSVITQEERATITIELTFEDQSTKKVIWSNKSFSGYQDYTFTDVSTKETNRKNALVKLSNDTAERAYRLMMSGF